ncbi:MAG: trigger factor [Gammaproteobacteria bacterium]|nr:trigger factor [Gammaproteobacteria bacterium]MDE0251834.1 trigger factor [Gammaproteobacteria bacterium]MDE0403157.1 trigger factor [Gammaproteobacteria bacterium]
MEVIVRPLDELKRRVRVSLTEEEIDNEYDKDLAEITKKAELPGFRPGKVPVGVIEERYGPRILSDVHQRTLKDSLDKVVEQEKLDVLHYIELKVASKPSDRYLHYYFDALIFPKLDLTRLELLRITKPEVIDLDSAVDRGIARFVQKFAEHKSVDRPARLGDKIVIQVKDLGTEHINIDSGVRIDRQRFLNGQYELVLGDEWGKPHRFVKFLRPELVGKSVGDEFEIDWSTDEIVHPELESATQKPEANDNDLSIKVEQSEAEDEVPFAVPINGYRPLHRIKRLHLEVLVKEICDMELPELDKEFFAREDIYFEDLEKLQQATRNELTVQVDKASRSLIEDQIVDQFMAMNPVSIPEEYFEARLAELEEKSQHQDEFSDDEKTSLFRDWRHELCANIIVDQYVADNNIKLDRGLVEAALRADFQRYSHTPQLQDYILSKEHQIKVSRTVLTSQAFDDILSKIEVAQDKWTFNELMYEDIDLYYANSQPNGGPFSWRSAVSQEEIDEANRIEKELLQAEGTPPDQEGEVTVEPEYENAELPKQGWKSFLDNLNPFKKRDSVNE